MFPPLFARWKWNVYSASPEKCEHRRRCVLKWENVLIALCLSQWEPWCAELGREPTWNYYTTPFRDTVSTAANCMIASAKLVAVLRQRCSLFAYFGEEGLSLFFTTNFWWIETKLWKAYLSSMFTRALNKQFTRRVRVGCCKASKMCSLLW